MAVAAPVGAWFLSVGASSTVAAVGAAVAQGAVVGAVVGAATSAVQGDNILKGALKGALVGGVTAGVISGAGIASGVWTSAQQLQQSGATSLFAGTKEGSETALFSGGGLLNGGSTAPISSNVPRGISAAGGIGQQATATAASSSPFMTGVGQGVGQGIGVVGTSIMEADAAKEARKDLQEASRLQYTQEQERIAANVPAAFQAAVGRVSPPDWWNKHLVDVSVGRGLLA